MCKYTVKKQKLKKKLKNSSRRARDSKELPKIMHLRRKGYYKN